LLPQAQQLAAVEPAKVGRLLGHDCRGQAGQGKGWVQAGNC
jgi:hypothetical protein